MNKAKIDARLKNALEIDKIKKSGYYTLAEAARLIGKGYEVLRRARHEGRLVTLRENPKVVMGSQLINFLESPYRVKTTPRPKGTFRKVKEATTNTHSTKTEGAGE